MTHTHARPARRRRLPAGAFRPARLKPLDRDTVREGAQVWPA